MVPVKPCDSPDVVACSVTNDSSRANSDPRGHPWGSGRSRLAPFTDEETDTQVGKPLVLPLILGLTAPPSVLSSGLSSLTKLWFISEVWWVTGQKKRMPSQERTLWPLPTGKSWCIWILRGVQRRPLLVLEAMAPKAGCPGVRAAPIVSSRGSACPLFI